MPHVEASFEYCGLALLPHMNNFDLLPGTESTNVPLLNPFFFSGVEQAVLPRYCTRVRAA